MRVKLSCHGNGGSPVQTAKLRLSLFSLLSGVSGAEMVTVMEGDSVTLHTNLSEILNDDTILWLFASKDSLISQITRKEGLNSIYFTDDERFRHRLQVDQNTGSLTVRNIRIRHSGQYKLSISREINTIKIFHVTVLGVANRTDEVKSISVKEGKSVSLNIYTDIRPDDLILWRFGDQGILLAKIDVETNETSLNDDDERFRDRLKIDHQTGSLTITNTRTEHAGLYELQIRGSESSKRFLLSVNAGAALALSPGGIVGITFAVLLVLVVIVIYFRWKISKLQEQVLSENKKVEEGESLCLPTGVPELHKDYCMQWYYKDQSKDILIAEINNETHKYNVVDERFKNKLTLNPKTGDLTINNIKILHAGLYRLKFKSKMRTKHNSFMVMVTANTKLEAEGNNVPLMTGVTTIKPGDLILWTFGLKNCLIATVESSTSYIVERFRERLELDPQTGSLTITNISNTEYGHYKLQIINKEQTTFRRFIVLEPAEPKSEAKGNNVLLKTGVTTIKPGDLILWMFGAKNFFIARADSNKTAISERFKDRVQLDPQTGSLTITNISNREYGHYKVQIINEEKTTFRRFNVFDPDPETQGDENTALMSRKNDLLMLQDIS
ncbi:uncharacterized protein LOC120475653 [Pimephales promelas]|uniref:uncharacterized protein LOC120475653 n=1 Tax=Pimephales promelas TaxID=90988 RepID=UPI001955C6E7|nr:uncharacterized protein LOC120475653 [Pimephales promelas]